MATSRTISKSASRLIVIAEFCIIAIITLTPYWYALESEFVSDDFALIEKNNHFETPGIVRKLLSGDYFDYTDTLGKSYYWRPSSRLSMHLDYWLFGKQPFGYHFDNLIQFGLIGGVFYVILRRLTESRIAAFIGLLLYAFHPARTESVVWISGRTDLLATLGSLLGLGCYIQATAVSARRLPWAIGMFFATVMALTSKETAVLLPAIIILWSPRHAWKHRGMTFLLALPSLIYPITKYLAVHTLASWHGSHIAPSLIPALALKTIGYYSKLIVYPVCLNTEPWFEYPSTYLDAGVLTGLLVSASLFCLLWIYRTHDSIRLGIIWFLIALFPHLNIIPIPNLAADRFLTLPSIGLSMIASGLLAYLFRRLSRRIMIPVTIGCLLICCQLGYLAYVQTAHWETDEAMTLRAAECGESARAKFWLGQQLMSEKKPADALKAFQLSSQREEVPSVLVNHTVAMLAIQLDELAIAETHLRATLTIEPQHDTADITLAETLLKQGKFNDAAIHAEHVLSRKPQEPVAHLVLAEICAVHHKDQECARRHLIAVVTNPSAPESQRTFAQEQLDLMMQIP